MMRFFELVFLLYYFLLSDGKGFQITCLTMYALRTYFIQVGYLEPLVESHSRPQIRGRAPLGQYQESRPLGGVHFRSMRRVIVSYS